MQIPVSYKLKAIISLLICSFHFSCSEQPTPKQNYNSKELKETLMEVNKNLMESEDRNIEEYIKRYGWEMEKTGTGLRYMIYEHGKGEKAKIGKIAILNYKLGLLDGSTCYTSDEKGPKIFKIGHGGVESGLEEAILFLQVGDRSKFILPSHLAFGLVGDSEKIPAKASLVYDIELIELK